MIRVPSSEVANAIRVPNSEVANAIRVPNSEVANAIRHNLKNIDLDIPRNSSWW